MGKGDKYEIIIRDLRELSSVAFIVYRAWHGGQAVTGMEIEPTKDEKQLPAKYRQILDELDSLGLTNLHYRMSTYAAEVIIKTKRIITLLEIDTKYKKKISDELERILRMFRYEITLLEEKFGSRQVIEQTRALKKKLQELEALI